MQVSDNVVRFPVERTRTPQPITCMDCEHVTVGTRGLYCSYFNEPIVYEDVAQECSEFDPI